MSEPRRFTVRYAGSTDSHWGVEHITLKDSESKEDLLETARKIGKDHGLGEITWIQFNDGGDPQPVWNGERAVKTGGDGWLYDWPALSLGLVFAEKTK